MVHATLVLTLIPALALAQAEPTQPPLSTVVEDHTVVMTDEDELLLGASRQKVTPLELFRALGRTDLVQQGELNAKRRTAFIIASAVVGVVGIAGAVAIFATTPDLTMGACGVDVALYNSKCRSEASLHQVLGATTLAVGILGAGVLASLALWSRPEVLSTYELRKFVDEQGKGQNPAAPAPPPQVHFSPWLGTDSAGLVAHGTF